MDLKKLKKDLLQDKQFKKYYNSDNIAFNISEMVIDARIKRGLTQKELAKKVGTKQSGIARLESGKNLPSLSFLQKISKALNAKITSPTIILNKK